jgi:hypothetical protein
MGQRDLNPQRHAEFQMSVETQENFRESSRSLKPVIAVKMNVLEEMLMNCYTSPEFCYHKAIVEVSSRQIKESLEMVMVFFFANWFEVEEVRSAYGSLPRERMETVFALIISIFTADEDFPHLPHKLRRIGLFIYHQKTLPDWDLFRTSMLRAFSQFMGTPPHTRRFIYP